MNLLEGRYEFKDRKIKFSIFSACVERVSMSRHEKQSRVVKQDYIWGCSKFSV